MSLLSVSARTYCRRVPAPQAETEAPGELRGIVREARHPSPQDLGPGDGPQHQVAGHEEHHRSPRNYHDGRGAQTREEIDRNPEEDVEFQYSHDRYTVHCYF